MPSINEPKEKRNTQHIIFHEQRMEHKVFFFFWYNSTKVNSEELNVKKKETTGKLKTKYANLLQFIYLGIFSCTLSDILYADIYIFLVS